MNSKQATIAEVVAAVREAKPSATELAEISFAEIAKQDPAIHAFLTLSRERALAAAAAIDQQAAQGDPLPPLAGVPIGIKDVLVMKGSPATAGSRILEGYRPPYDATVVQRLEAAGAILLGKLNCDEFAMGSSNENSGYGPVHNPGCVGSGAGWVQRRLGGSSRSRHGRGHPGHRHGRFHPPAGIVLRRGGRVADLRTRLSLRVDRVCFLA